MSPYYDPLIAKGMVWGMDRREAIDKMTAFLKHTNIKGISTNIPLLRKIIANPEFLTGNYATNFIKEHFLSQSIEIKNPGFYTSIQSFPGRVGYWNVGVPPSGPMDILASRIANHLVSNHEEASTLEITALGPQIQFNCDTIIALTGAKIEASLTSNGSIQEVPWWKPILVKKDAVLSLKGILGPGYRAYLAVYGGFDVPHYLGSQCTFPFGKLGL